MPTPPLAAIDIGSNAIRFGAGTVNAHGKLTMLATAREPIRLGADVFRDGRISPRLRKQTVEALKQFKKLAHEHEVSTIRAVATSAFRDAENQEAVVQEIEESTQIRVEVIDGSEEAQLIQRAVRHSVPLTREVALLIDIGGGSVEISVVVEGVVVFSDSVRAGAVRLLQFLNEKKPSLRVFERFVSQYTYGVTKQVERELKLQPITLCVGTGGNIEALGELAVSTLGARSRERLSLQHLSKLIDMLSGMSTAERIEQFALRPDRADVIVPAAVVLHQVAKSSGASSITIPRVGVREGVILSMETEHLGLSLDQEELQSIAFALDLGRRLSFDEAHGSTVARHAEALFEATTHYHKLPPRCCLLLRIAALLHDVGQVISMSGHHKHSQYIIGTSPLLGISKKERQVIAVTARYHRKAPPSPKHEEFAKLDDHDRETVRRLSALLRVADALDREHLGRVKRFSLNRRKQGLVLTIEGEGDCALERWAVNKKALSLRMYLAFGLS